MSTTDPSRVWRYEHVVDYVYDGDTIMGELDMGLGCYMRPISLRLYGINAPELRGTKDAVHEAALASRDNLRSLVNRGDVLTVMSYSWDKYSNRIDAVVYAPGDTTSLNQHQLDGGFAVVYLPG